MDRLTDAIARVVRALMPDPTAITMYRAKVVKQSADLARVDVVFDDSRIGGLQEVPLQLGLPGTRAQISPGAYVLVGWRNGDRRFPFAALHEGGETVVKVVIDASSIYVGGEDSAEPAALGQTLQSFLDKVAEHVHLSSAPGAPTGPAIDAMQQPLAPAPNVKADRARVV